MEIKAVPQAVQSCHDLLLWIIPHLNKFPRIHRFTLGERLETRLLSVLEDLVEAAYSKQKATALQRANRTLEIIRHLWRLSHELKIISTNQYEYGAKLVNEVGRQIGGWLKSQS